MVTLFYNKKTVTELVSVAIVALLRNSLLIGPVMTDKFILIGSRTQNNLCIVFIKVLIIDHL